MISRFQSFGIAAIAFSVCSCVGVDYSDPVYQEFKGLCRTKAGTHIYETVENVDGVFGLGPREGLLKYGYMLVEFNIPNSFSQSSLKRMLADDHGLYRYTLEREQHPKCQKFYAFYESWLSHGRSIPRAYDGYCLVSEKIQRESANFGVISEQIGPQGEPVPGTITGLRTKFQNLEGSKLYAEHYYFSYLPKSAPTKFVQGDLIYQKCFENDNSERNPPPVDQIFIPPSDRAD